MEKERKPDGHNRISARFPDLEGEVAIVTGTSRGIGCGIARFLGRQGMKLTLTARSTRRGQAFADELLAAGVDCQWVTADVSAAEGAEGVLAATLEQYGGLDLLVNNAANLRSTDFLHLKEEVYQESFERNVRIVYELSFRAARHMAESGRGGNIVSISSVGGLRAHRGLAGYDASKGAINALTRDMAIDLAPSGIRVNAVAPGAVWKEGRRGPSSRTAEGIPLGRLATVEEIGAAVAFLASDAAAYITGQVLYVDGGLTTQLTPPGIWI